MKVFALPLLLFSFQIALSQISSQIDWQFGALGDELGKAGIIAEDIDQNGIVDIISTGNFDYFGSYITIIEWDTDQNTYYTKRMSNLFPDEITTMAMLDFDNNGEKELYVGFVNGIIQKHNLLTLKKEQEVNIVPFSLNLLNPTFKIKFGDIYSDNSIKLIAVQDSATYIFNKDLELIYETSYGAKCFEIGDIDNDNKKEIIYSNGNIFEFQKDSIIQDHRFITENKKTNIRVGDMNNDNVLDIVYSSNDTIYIYDLYSYNIIWTQVWEDRDPQWHSVEKLWLFDYDEDKIPDVFASYENDSKLHCYNGNEVETFTLEDGLARGATNVLVTDLDNDAKLDIIWATGGGSTASDHFYIHDIPTQAIKWKSHYFEGNFKAFDVGDVDNDGTLEIVLGNQGELTKYFDYSFLTIFDAKTKRTEWQNKEEYFPGILFKDGPSKIKIGDIDNDNKNELLVGIDNFSNGTYVHALDSLYKIERTYRVSGMGIVRDMEIADIDNDNRNELIVTLGTGTSFGKKDNNDINCIYIFDGETGELEWKSEELGRFTSHIGMLSIGNVDEDDAKEIIAMKYLSHGEDNELYIIDGITHEMTIDTSRNYYSIDVADINNDGKSEIIGKRYRDNKIEIIDGNLKAIKSLSGDSFSSRSFKLFDFNEDGKLELVFSDWYTIGIYDLQNETILWQSDKLNNQIGIHNSLYVGNIDDDDKTEILVNAQHGIFSFEVDYDESVNGDSIMVSYNLIESSNRPIYYPNPFRNELSAEVSSNIPELFDVIIYDLNGNAVLIIKNQNLRNFKIKDIDKLSIGYYFISIQKNDFIFSQEKIIKVE